MKQYFIISLFSLLTSCSSINCYNDLEGKYINTRDPKSDNYLIIYDNGTYYHYFKKDNLEYSCKGIWEKSKHTNCGIELDNFENYNELGANYKVYSSYLLLKDGKFLNDGFDGENDNSFVKKR